MELDFEKLCRLTEASTNPQVAENALSISDVLKNIDKLLNLLDRAERSPLISTVVRSQAAKAGIEVKAFNQEPVIKYVEVGIKPASPTHELMFIELNKMPEQQLKDNLAKMEQSNDRVHTESGETNDQQHNTT